MSKAPPSSSGEKDADAEKRKTVDWWLEELKRQQVKSEEELERYGHAVDIIDRTAQAVADRILLPKEEIPHQ